MKFDSKLTFGKYKGFTINNIYKMDSPYLLWVLENTIYLFQLSREDKEKIRQKANEQYQLETFTYDR